MGWIKDTKNKVSQKNDVKRCAFRIIMRIDEGSSNKPDYLSISFWNNLSIYSKIKFKFFWLAILEITDKRHVRIENL